MLFRWLLSVFPRELRLAWPRIAPDAFVWCTVAALLTVLPYVELLIAPVGAGPEGSTTWPRMASALVALARIAAPPLVFVVAAARFASPARRNRSWASVGSLAARRTVPALAAWAAASALAIFISMIAQWAVLAVLSEMEGTKQAMGPLSKACRIFIYVSVMARFAFVPFIVALERRDTAPERRRSRGAFGAAAYLLAWPLIESWARTQALAWRLFPYALLLIYAPVAAGFVSPAAHAPASFLLQLVSFTALAVLFNHYSGTSERPHAAEQPAS